MRRRAAIVVSLLQFAGTCLAEPIVDTAPRQQVIATERAFARTMADRDFASFADFVSAEAVFFSEGGTLHGRQEVTRHWQRYFDAPAAPFSWEPESVEVLDSGTLALSTGPVRDAAGKLIGTFTSVWRLEASGRWRIIFDKGDCACAKPYQAYRDD